MTEDENNLFSALRKEDTTGSAIESLIASGLDVNVRDERGVTIDACAEVLFPQRVEIELVSDCNLRCTYCPRHYLNELTGYIDFAFFRCLIDEISKYPNRVVVLHRRGESLLHPHFCEMCDYVAGKFSEVQLATNATVLNRQKSEAIIGTVSFLSFSIDTPERYNRTRHPALYADVERKILDFLELNRRRVKTQVSMVRTSDTDDEEIALFQKIWVDRVDRVRIYEEHSEGGKFGALPEKRFPRFPCVMPGYEMLVWCDGRIGRCNHDWNGPALGDANKNSLLEIFNSDVYNDLRRQHQEINLTDPVCRDCDCWYAEIGNQGTGLVINPERKKQV